MESTRSRISRIAILFSMVIVAFAWIALSGGSVAAQDGQEFEDFNPENFNENSTNIDNKWLPLKPGTKWVYEGMTVVDGEDIPHVVVFTVTDLTKVIAGVQTVVCRDEDFSDGKLVKTEIVFLAQDKDGNVWHFGQYREEYEHGGSVTARAWVHDIGEAKAGIMMKAEPRLGAPSYSQGWAPSASCTDRGVAYKMGVITSVPFGTFEDVLIISESSQEDPNAYQLKYYAPGVGNVRVGWRGEYTTQENLALVEFGQLSPDDLATARAKALALEKNAYERSKDIYGQTEPAGGISGTSGQ